MKGGLFILRMAAFVMVTTLSAACGKEKTYDFFNTNITIRVQDSEGNNLCSSRYSQNHILRDNIWIEHAGKTWEMDTGLSGTRGDGAPRWPDTYLGWKPFRWNREQEKERAALLFGEFSVDTKAYRGEPFTIFWGDGKQSDIEFDLYSVSRGKKTNPAVQQAIRVVSGVGVGAQSDNSLIITIVK